MKELSPAESLMECSNKMTMQLLEGAKDGERVTAVQDKWFEAALQVLASQGIMPLVFMRSHVQGFLQGKRDLEFTMTHLS